MSSKRRWQRGAFAAASVLFWTEAGDRMDRRPHSEAAYAAEVTSPGQVMAGAGRGPVQDSAYQLFAHDNTTSTIIRIDSATGRATTVGRTGFDSGASSMDTSGASFAGPDGVTYAAGTLVALLRDEDDTEDYVTVIDPESGRGTKVVRTASKLRGRGIAFGPDGSTLFALHRPGVLVTIDTETGAVTDVGQVTDEAGTALDGVSLTLDADRGDFLAFMDGTFRTLVRIDPDTGRASRLERRSYSAWTLARAPGPVPGPGGSTWPAGTIFTIDSSTHTLHAITLDSQGAFASDSVVGPLGAAANEVAGSAFAVVEGPTPTATNAPPETPTSPAPNTPTSTPTPTATGSSTPTRSATATSTDAPSPSPSVTPEPTALVPTPPVPACVCPVLLNRVPSAVIAHALANPERYYGWLLPRDQGKPPGPSNPLRECLGLSNPGRPYHPFFNGPIWQAGCR